MNHKQKCRAQKLHLIHNNNISLRYDKRRVYNYVGIEFMCSCILDYKLFAAAKRWNVERPEYMSRRMNGRRRWSHRRRRRRRWREKKRKKQTKRDETVSRISKIHSTFISHFASLLNFHLSSSLPLSRWTVNNLFQVRQTHHCCCCQESPVVVERWGVHAFNVKLKVISLY